MAVKNGTPRGVVCSKHFSLCRVWDEGTALDENGAFYWVTFRLPTHLIFKRGQRRGSVPKTSDAKRGNHPRVQVTCNKIRLDLDARSLVLVGQKESF